MICPLSGQAGAGSGIWFIALWQEDGGTSYRSGLLSPLPPSECTHCRMMKLFHSLHTQHHEGQSDPNLQDSQPGVEELWEPGEGASEPNRG